MLNILLDEIVVTCFFLSCTRSRFQIAQICTLIGKGTFHHHLWINYITTLCALASACAQRQILLHESIIEKKVPNVMRITKTGISLHIRRVWTIFYITLHPWLSKMRLVNTLFVLADLNLRVWCGSVIIVIDLLTGINLLLPWIDTRAEPCLNVSSGICGQRRLRSDCACAQSDQMLHCPLTESLESIELLYQWRANAGWNFAHVRNQS